MVRLPAGCLLGLALCTGTAAGQDKAVAKVADVAPAAGRDGVVHVNAIKDPEMRSYRSIEAGFDAFDDHRALAPTATLRFTLRHKNGGPAGPADGLQLRLASDDGAIAQNIPVGANGGLALGRIPGAHDADASFILNRRSGLFTAHPDVRTPGLPDNVRRLGDLRLECRVTIAIVKDQIPFMARATINTLLLTTDWCGNDKVNMGLPASRRLASATLRAGERTETLACDAWRFTAPIGDRRWPDDALVELVYEEETAAAAAP